MVEPGVLITQRYETTLLVLASAVTMVIQKGHTASPSSLHQFPLLPLISHLQILAKSRQLLIYDSWPLYSLSPVSGIFSPELTPVHPTSLMMSPEANLSCHLQCCFFWAYGRLSLPGPLGIGWTLSLLFAKQLCTKVICIISWLEHLFATPPSPVPSGNPHANNHVWDSGSCCSPATGRLGGAEPPADPGVYIIHERSFLAWVLEITAYPSPVLLKM